MTVYICKLCRTMTSDLTQCFICILGVLVQGDGNDQLGSIVLVTR